jgi:hypothetical protein
MYEETKHNAKYYNCYSESDWSQDFNDKETKHPNKTTCSYLEEAEIHRLISKVETQKKQVNELYDIISMKKRELDKLLREVEKNNRKLKTLVSK